MSVAFSYLSLQELDALSLQELEDLWDSVPTENRDTLDRRYRQKVKDQQISDDQAEIQLVDTYLQRYQYEGLVPAGKQWLRISTDRRHEYEREPLDSIDTGSDEGGIPRILWVIGGAVLLFMLTIISTNLLGGAGAADTDLSLSPTPTTTVTLTPSPTPTQTPIPTSTPLALVDSDPFIEAGERGNRRLYPVQFQIHPSGEALPRVFIVQERAIETTEWHFDPNPDVASWLSGTHVRPIIGIPYSESNRALLEDLDENAVFVLRMNTGMEIRFQYSRTGRIGREETSLLRQDTPGVVLLLIGETDRNGLPTAQRQIVLGSYAVPIELPQSGTGGLPAQIGDTITVAGLNVQVLATALRPMHNDLTSPYLYALVEVEVNNSTNGELDIALATWQLLGETMRYTPDLAAYTTFDLPSLPRTLAAGQTATGTLIYLVAAPLQNAQLLFADARVHLSFTALQVPLSAEQLTIDLREVTLDNNAVHITLRLYNPLSDTVTLTANDVGIVYGFTEQPRGPTVRATAFEDLTVNSGQAQDLTLTFVWNADDPFAHLMLAEHFYRLRLLD